jgi:hypothetical protein
MTGTLDFLDDPEPPRIVAAPSSVTRMVAWFAVNNRAALAELIEGIDAEVAEQLIDEAFPK